MCIDYAEVAPGELFRMQSADLPFSIGIAGTSAPCASEDPPPGPVATGIVRCPFWSEKTPSAITSITSWPETPLKYVIHSRQRWLDTTPLVAACSIRYRGRCGALASREALWPTRTVAVGSSLRQLRKDRPERTR